MFVVTSKVKEDQCSSSSVHGGAVREEVGPGSPVCISVQVHCLIPPSVIWTLYIINTWQVSQILTRVSWIRTVTSLINKLNQII